MKDRKGNVMAVLSAILGILITTASLVSLATPDFYAAESINWQVQSVGQDMVNLFLIVPCLIVSAIFYRLGKKNAGFILSGTLLYIAYTFTIYCFDIHFNQLFLLYCICLGLSVYALAYFLLMRLYGHNNPSQLIGWPVIKVIAVYFIFIATVFYLLWLSEIIPAMISNTVPDSVIETGLFTNGVHVIDLSFFLPLVFITGILLLRKKKPGLILAPILLCFFILMDITIGFLALLMYMENMQSSITIVIVMAFFSILSCVLLLLYFQKSRQGLRIIPNHERT